MIGLFILVGILLLAAVNVGIYTLIAYGILWGLEALGVLQASWQAALGLGLVLAIVTHIFGSKRQ